MRRAAGFLFFLVACACAALPAPAEEPAIPLPVAYVNDTAGVMGDWAERTEALCREIERLTSAEVGVLTVKTTGGIPVQGYAQRVFDRWNIGKKGKDNGVLFLVAVGDRKMWIATGYGVEGVLPDGKVGEIRDRVVLPRFREGKYGEGIFEGVSSLGSVLRGVDAPIPAHRSARVSPAYFLAGSLFFLLLILYLFRDTLLDIVEDYKEGRLPNYRGYGGGDGGGGFWGGFGGGGFGGGGFGGFGGGGGGGGGAGGGW
jgi:uncharacterized protein